MCNCEERINDSQYEKLTDMLDNYRETTGKLIPVLQETQHIFGYLPEDAIKQISAMLNIPVSEIFGVATFYGQFHLKPRGKNIIKACTGTACHVRGGGKLLQTIRETLGLSEEKNTTDDLQFTLEPVACLGACGMAPVIMINDDVYGKLTPDNIPEILRRYTKEETVEGGQEWIA